MLFLMLLSPLAFAAELKMVKVSELKPGQVIVDKEGNEIPITNLTTQEKHYTTISEIINNLLNKNSNQNNIEVYTGAGQSGAGIVDITGNVVSGGNLITGKEIYTTSFNYNGFVQVRAEDSSTGSINYYQYPSRTLNPLTWFNGRNDFRQTPSSAQAFALAGASNGVYDYTDPNSGMSFKNGDPVQPAPATPPAANVADPPSLPVTTPTVAPAANLPDIPSLPVDKPATTQTPVIANSILIGGASPAPTPATLINTNSKAITLMGTGGITVGTISPNEQFTLITQTGSNGQTYQIKKNDGTLINIDQATYNSLQAGQNGVQYQLVNDKTIPKGSTYNPSTGLWQAPSGAFYNNAGKFVDRGQVQTAFGTLDFGWGQLVQGVQWAVIAGGFVQFFGRITGATEEEVNAVSLALSAGIMAGKASYALFGRGGVGGFVTSGNTDKYLPDWMSTPSFSIGVGVATSWLIYNSMWEKETTRTETITFQCLPWQAPHGGTDCELCNSDPTLPCSEYRCKSLGQTCGIINKGTKSEKCANMNVRDVSPPVVSPWDQALDPPTLKYSDVKTNPPGAGFKIKSTLTTTGCVKPYSTVQFGVQTNEPAQCKIDYVQGKNYSLMATYLGGTNIYDYNHTDSLSLPSANSFKNSSITLQNGKELNLFIKCQDSMGNVNEADYEMTICVDPSDDTTPPLISATTVPSGSCVASTSQNSSMTFYTNEPAECRWSTSNQNYDSMQNNMSCSNSITDINALQLYACTTSLTGITQSGSDFYVRCKDQPGINESKRNANTDSYKFTLRSSNPLKMGTISPNITIYGPVSPMPIELSTSTLFGCENGKSICYYSSTGADSSFVKFFDTDTTDGIHTQRLDLSSGTYTYTVKCVDAGGNVAQNSTTFQVNIDPNAPIIARVYEEDDYLKVVTPTNSECFFSNQDCDFLNEGSPMPYANSTTHITPWFADKTYYIKCKDDYRSLPTACSLVVKPTENFL